MKIACWSGPRNISTALMRSWSSRKDTVVIDEPFYAYYLKKTKLKHPMHTEIMKIYSTDKNFLIKYLTSANPQNSKIWYQKHMAHHILNFDKLDFLLLMENTFLIRHPRKVISSYAKKNELISENDLGYKHQEKLINYLSANKKEFTIIDADKLLQNPTSMIKNWCEKINIKFDTRMLKWKNGYHQYDGIWAKHWYDSVIKTKTFQKKQSKTIDPIAEKYREIYDKSIKIYDKMLGMSL